METKAAFRENAIRELDAYLDGVETAARCAGAVRIPVKSAQELGEHLEWLARYRVKGESMTKIWQSINDSRGRPRGAKKNDKIQYSRSYDAIRKAIHRTAELIGLTLRYPQKPSR